MLLHDSQESPCAIDLDLCVVKRLPPEGVHGALD